MLSEVQQHIENRECEELSSEGRADEFMYIRNYSICACLLSTCVCRQDHHNTPGDNDFESLVSCKNLYIIGWTACTMVDDV